MKRSRAAYFLVVPLTFMRVALIFELQLAKKYICSGLTDSGHCVKFFRSNGMPKPAFEFFVVLESGLY